MELRQIRNFIILAEELHFGNAAKRICIAQSALSLQIKKLEEELQSPLFLRDTHHVSLTDMGRVFLKESRKVLQQVRQAETAVSQTANGYGGKLSVGFVESALWDIMPGLIQDFRREYPNVELVPCHMNTLGQMEALRQGDIQAGFVGACIASPGISHHLIRQEPCLLAVAREHPLAKKDQVTVRSLSAEKFIAIRRECGPFYYDSFIQACMDNAFSPNIVLTADEMQPLLAFVASGIGIALIQESARNIRNDLCYLPVEGVNEPRYQILLAWNERDASMVLQNFVKKVKDRYPSAKDA